MLDTYFYSCNEFDIIRDDWFYLQSGAEMTYFQQYNWYQLIVKDNRKKHLLHEMVFVLVKEDAKALMIAPLWINKSILTGYRKGGYFLGREGWSDYCNFVYRDFREDAVREILEECHRKYNVSYFRFDNLREDTATYNYFRRIDLKFDYMQKCVKLILPDCDTSYIAMLSKNGKQNIRTAVNRAEKDGVSLNISFDVTSPDLKDFHHYRLLRVKQKTSIPLNTLGLKIFLSRSLSQLKFHFPQNFPYLNDINGKFLMVTEKNTNTFIAGFYYGYNNNRREICIMGVSLNEEFKRYSPGMVALFQFVKFQIKSKKIESIDFTRGTEKYKYVLGGRDHYIHHIGLLYK